MPKSWEKTVEWHFASDALRWLTVVSPLDGEKEISDLLAKINDTDWVLIEFKHSEEDFNDEDQKFPKDGNKAMQSFLGKYFGFNSDFHEGNSKDELKKYASKLEAHPSFLEYIDAASLNLSEMSTSPDNRRVVKQSITVKQNNLNLLSKYVKSAGGGNPLAVISSNLDALHEKYVNGAKNSDSLEGGRKNVFDSLPEGNEPHHIVFGRRKSDVQKLCSLRYWSYKKDANKRIGLIKALDGKGNILQNLEGASHDKFLCYLNALSYARGYIPELDIDKEVDRDDFGYFAAIGIFKTNGRIRTKKISRMIKRRAIVFSGDIAAIKKQVENWNVLLKESNKNVPSEEKASFISQLKKIYNAFSINLRKLRPVKQQEDRPEILWQ